jgi:hypothetical protein
MRRWDGNRGKASLTPCLARTTRTIGMCSLHARSEGQSGSPLGMEVLKRT